MDNEMIERVAASLKNDWLTNRAENIDQFFKSLAIVTLKAMREPTEKMMVAMENAEPQLECFLEKEKSPSYLVWIAAIDAIIKG